MIHIIVCGHGAFATGLLSGARLLCGEGDACDAVDFSEGMSGEALQTQLRRCVAQAENSPVLFLTDILGGTPFRESSVIASEHGRAEVISGANLQMLTEALLEREGEEDVRAFAQALVQSAKECITLLSDKLANQAQKNIEPGEEDGI